MIHNSTSKYILKMIASRGSDTCTSVYSSITQHIPKGGNNTNVHQQMNG